MAKKSEETNPNPQETAAATAPAAPAAPASYKVVFSGAGPFKRDDVVTEQQIRAAGYLPDHWMQMGAIEAAEPSK